MSKSRLSITCHNDGTVTYWSVYDQSWRRRVRSVSDAHMATFSPAERERVARHLAEWERSDEICSRNGY